MSEEQEEKPDVEEEDAPEDSADPIDSDAEDRMRDLLKGALESSEGGEDPHVLSGVQRRIRERSGGKFYADEWSTSKQSPTYTYLYTSLVMLLIVGVVYSFLSSLSDQAAEIENTPAPVRIVFPKNR